MLAAPDPPRVSILLLAAGRSSRFGRPKQLVPFKGTTLLRYLAAEAFASKASEVIVVLGSDHKLTRKELSGIPVRITENRGWKKGMSSSIKVGLKAAKNADAVLITLCDQPFVTHDLLNALIECFGSTAATLVACEYSGTLGVPALFPKQLFGELRKLEGDIGAKSIITRHRDEAQKVPFPRGSIDIDKPKDLEQLSV